jgi:hypothetical protein
MQIRSKWTLFEKFRCSGYNETYRKKIQLAIKGLKKTGNRTLSI